MYWMKNICFGIKNIWIWFSVSNVIEVVYWISNIVIRYYYFRFMYILLEGLKIGYYFIYIIVWIVFEYELFMNI